MTSLKYVLEPFSPLKGDVKARCNAEPAVRAVSVCFEQMAQMRTGFERRRRDT
jgi:hypothetical protein